ncbi:MAG: hypothetical protein ACYC2H_12420 [Thermoplasmatota archaeon]
MGFSAVGATAVLLAALAVAGHGATVAIFDTQESLLAARDKALALDTLALRASHEIVSVAEAAGTVTVVTRNTGSVTLLADEVDVLLDGGAATVDTRTVDGVTSVVWPPGTVLTMTLTAAAPDDVAVVSGAGIAAFWRA